MLIYLIGFMGCGKTTIGKKLANKLKYRFIDLDKLIERESGETIFEIFESLNGENRFRILETNALKKVSGLDNTVIATGGGTPCFNENIQLMNQTGKTVYIKMHHGSLFLRLAKSKKNRPLIGKLTDVDLMDQVMHLLSCREPFYSQAQFTVKGESLSPDTLIELFS